MVQSILNVPENDSVHLKWNFGRNFEKKQKEDEMEDELK